MYLTSKNDLLYDSKNFNKYSNIYTVLINTEKKSNLDSDDSELHTRYFSATYTLQIYFMIESFNGYNGVYKIVYGHYYNNKDMFLYKNTYNDNIIKREIKKCYAKELLHNKNNNLICATTYKNVRKQLDIIVQDNDRKYEKQNIYPLTISYDVEILTIKSNGKFSTNYLNGNLIILK